MPKEKFDFYQHTTDAICKEIQRAIDTDKVLPWQRPIRNLGRLRNFNSKRPYRGWINQMMLHLAGYQQPLWATYRGWREAAYREWAKKNKIKIEDADLKALNDKALRNTDNVKAFFEAGGGGVSAGETSRKVFFWAVVPNKKHDPSNPESREVFFFMRVYSVWNIEQTTGIPIPSEAEQLEFVENDTAEEIWNGWEDAPEVIDGSMPDYSWTNDKVIMPDASLFNSEGEYYYSLFHEGIHATGHKDRLNRPEVKNGGYNTEPYGKEELTAEMGAAILASMCDLDREAKENSVAYLTEWYRKLSANPKLLVQASTKAASACDYILGVKYDKETEAE
jgi:antirestriction protein ArdC